MTVRKIIDRVYLVLSIAFLIILMTDVVVLVIMRDIFSVGSPKLDEFSKFALIALTFFCIPVLASDNRHIRVTALLIALPPKPRKIMEFVLQLITSLICLSIGYALFVFLQRSGKTLTSAMRMPNYVFYFPVICSCIYLIFVSIGNCIAVILGGTAA